MNVGYDDIIVSSDEDEVLDVLQDTANQKERQRKAPTYKSYPKQDLMSKRQHPAPSWRYLSKQQMIDFFLADDESQWAKMDTSPHDRQLAEDFLGELGNTIGFSPEELQQPTQLFLKLFPEELRELIIRSTNSSIHREVCKIAHILENEELSLSIAHNLTFDIISIRIWVNTINS